MERQGSLTKNNLCCTFLAPTAACATKRSSIMGLKLVSLTRIQIHLPIMNGRNTFISVPIPKDGLPSDGYTSQAVADGLTCGAIPLRMRLGRLGFLLLNNQNCPPKVDRRIQKHERSFIQF